MSDTQVAATLTDEQLTEVLTLAPVQPFEAIVTCWKHIVPEWETLARGGLKPWTYSLPQSQWGAICHALTQYQGPGHGLLEGANLALDWMNKGPSVRDDQ